MSNVIFQLFVDTILFIIKCLFFSLVIINIIIYAHVYLVYYHYEQLTLYNAMTIYYTLFLNIHNIRADLYEISAQYKY